MTPQEPVTRTDPNVPFACEAGVQEKCVTMVPPGPPGSSKFSSLHLGLALLVCSGQPIHAQLADGTGKETTQPMNAAFPVSRQFGPIDIREYRQIYQDVGQGWVPNGEIGRAHV